MKAVSKETNTVLKAMNDNPGVAVIGTGLVQLLELHRSLEQRVTKLENYIHDKSNPRKETTP